MAYASDAYEARQKKMMMQRQAVERRISIKDGKPQQKNPNADAIQELIRRRKEGMGGTN